jgi:hypothetical protein
MSPITIEILAVHGVNHDAEARETFGPEWERALNAGAPSGIRYHVTPAPWSSMGDGLKDSLRICYDRAYRERVRGEVYSAMRGWSVRTMGEPRCIVGHSMGTALGADAMHQFNHHVRSLNMVAIGSPMTHPIFGPALEKAATPDRYNRSIPAIQNFDDGICAIKTPFGPVMRKPKRFRVVEVAIETPHRLPWPDEHDQVMYLIHEETQAAITEAAGIVTC